jgi:hypothetical protein
VCRCDERLKAKTEGSTRLAYILGDWVALKKFICSRIKKKAKAESKNCHAKTMLSLEKPIKLI